MGAGPGIGSHGPAAGGCGWLTSPSGCIGAEEGWSGLSHRSIQEPLQVDYCELLDELASVPDGETASHASSAQKATSPKRRARSTGNRIPLLLFFNRSRILFFLFSFEMSF